MFSLQGSLSESSKGTNETEPCEAAQGGPGSPGWPQRALREHTNPAGLTTLKIAKNEKNEMS